MENPTNKFGIRVTLPEGNTMAMEHLLGEDWEYFRWFSSAEKRDTAFTDMQRQPRNYRIGDTIKQVLQKVDKD